MGPDEFFAGLSAISVVLCQIIQPLGSLVLFGIVGTFVCSFCIVVDGYYHPPYRRPEVAGRYSTDQVIPEGLLGPNASGFKGLKELKAAEMAAKTKS